MLVAGLGSCTKERQLPGEQSDKEYIDFSLELTPPGSFTAAQTRAMTDKQQNAINRAEVLVFQNNILLYHKTGTTTDIDGVQKRVQVNLKTSQSESDLFDIMVIGNPPSGFNFAPYVNKTKDELKLAFNVSATGKWSADEFVMYGEALQTLVKPATNNFKIQMLRTLARMDIGVGAYNETTDTWAGLGNFSLTEVRIVNSRDKFAVIPSATSLSPTGNIKVDAPTIPSGTAVQGTTAATAIQYSGTDITIVNGMGTHTKYSIFLAEAPSTTDQVTIIVGGSYLGLQTTYYRIDMSVRTSETQDVYRSIDLLRNHLYRINIVKITGRGLATPEEALASQPLNITTSITPIAEGDSGNVIFGGDEYIMTDISDVMIYGTPDGQKKYTMFTVKAGFPSGGKAVVTGTGITTPLNLTSGVPQTISLVIPANTTSIGYSIHTGNLAKSIPVKLLPPVDAHFDILLFQDVASISIENPQPWITLSHNMTYVRSEQKPSYIFSSNNKGKAVIHFDENIATTGNPRMAQALVLRNTNRGTTRVHVEQVNLSGMIIGLFGGSKGNEGYSAQLAIESVDEFRERVYDDTSISRGEYVYIKWEFMNLFTGSTDIDLGRRSTFELGKRSDSGIAGPYTIYNTYAARYCYDKNRDQNGNGVIDDGEVVWYLPSVNQAMGVWIGHNGLSKPLISTSYWTSTETAANIAWDVSFSIYGGSTSAGPKTSQNRYVRCVREL